MTQLSLPLPPPPRREGLWPDLGRWMMGQGSEPVELAAVIIALRHRRKMRGER